MVVCPNKSLQSWKNLSEKLGEEKAMLAFIRNNSEIPESETQARDILTNVGLLNSLESIPTMTEEKMQSSLLAQGLTLDSFHEVDGKKFYALNPQAEDIGRKLGDITNEYGALLEYDGDYVTVSKEGLASWNAIATAHAVNNKTPEQLAKSFLTRIGVKVNEQGDVIKRYGSNGVAMMAERMVLIQSGKSKEALPEEALHFFIEMLPQDMPDLVKALDDVRDSSIYKEVLAQYKDNPNYRTKDGQIRFDKIRKEALAKQIAANMNAPKQSLIARIIQHILNWVNKTKIQKTPSQVIEEMFMSEDISRLNMNMESDEIYNQLNDELKTFYEAQIKSEAQRNTLKKIIDHSATINFQSKDHILEYVDLITGVKTKIPGTTTILGSDFYSKLDIPAVQKTLVNTFAYDYPSISNSTDDEATKSKKIANELLDELLRGDTDLAALTARVGEEIAQNLFDATENKKKTLLGTAVHAIAESIILDKEIDYDNPEIVDPIIYTFMNKATLERLINGTAYEPGIKGIIGKLVSEGNLIMTEIELGNTMVGGIADIIAIDTDGVAKVLDFKTKYLKTHAKNRPNIEEEFDNVTSERSTGGIKKDDKVLPELVSLQRTLKEKWSQQMSIYKKILMEAGIPVGETIIIGIPYRLDDTTKMVREVKAFMTKPAAFNDSIASSYFSDSLDMNLDMTKEKPAGSIQDERIKLLESISKPKMKEAYAKMKGRLDQLYAYFSKNKDAKAIYDLLVDEDDTNRVENMQRLVKNFLDNYGDNQDMSNMVAIQGNFINMIDSSGPIIDIIAKDFERIKNTISPTAEAVSQKLKELYKIREFVVGYQNMFKEMLSYLGTTEGKDNPLVSRLNEMVGAIQNIRNSYIDTISPLVGSALGSEFTQELLDNMKRQYAEEIFSAEQRGDKKRALALKVEMENLPSEKVIAELLKGEKGDAGWFFSKFLPTISNPDIIIAAVAKRLKRVLDGVRLAVKSFRDKMSPELEKRDKVYGRGLSIKQRNESLVYDTKVMNPKSGEERFQRFIKSEFHEELYYDYDKLRFELNKAKDAKDEDAIKAAKKAVKAFEQEFFQSDYTSEYFRMTGMMDTEVTYGGKRVTVREITGAIFEEIRSIEVGYGADVLAEGALSPEHLQLRQDLWESYYRLMEIKNTDGTDKTGEDLKIANILKEYQENKRLVFKDVEMTNMFEKAKTKMLLKYGESSPEYQKWYANNTRLKVSDKYYSDMDALMSELAALSHNPNAEKISNLYGELRTISQPFKDKDGFIQGQFMKSETVDRIKAIQAEIEELRDQVDEYTPDGFTYEEKQRVKELNYQRINDPLNYDKYEMQELYAARDNRLEADSDLKARVTRAKEIQSQLASMRTIQKTKYYFDELANQEQIFANGHGCTLKELKKDSELYEEFKQSDWYQENHTHKVKNVFDDEFGETVYNDIYTPIYIWTRNVPIKEYIEEVPARHFYRRETNTSYVNEAGETIQLLRDDNKDIQGRYKAKTNDEYRTEHGKDHKYLNKEYAALRTKYDNRTASEKEKVDYENLLFLQKSMLDAQDGNVEQKYKLGLAVPFMEKDSFDRAIETKGKNIKNYVGEMVDGLKRKLSRTEADANEGFAEEKSDLTKLATVDNDEVRFIPVKFTSRGEASNASYDVWGGVLNYVSSTIRKKSLDQELALINGLEEILGEKENQPKGEAKNAIINSVMKTYLPDIEKRINLGSNTRLEVLKSFVNSVLFNEEHFEGYDILGINTQKLVDKMMHLSSVTMLGLAPVNWTVNWLSGQVQNMVEAAGGTYYNFKDYLSSKKEIYISTKHGHIMKDMMSDFSKVGNKSFWGQIMEVWDPIQGETENELGHKTAWNNFRNILKAGIFAGKIWGEWEIQMSSFIAFMKNLKVYNGKIIDKESFLTLKLGTDFTGMTGKELRKKRIEALQEFDKLSVTMLDILELKADGQLGIKDQYAGAFEIGGKQFSDLVGKLHSMQKRINGSYAKFDNAYAGKSSLGRMMFFFRKYLIQLGMNRLGQRRPDFEGMTVEQGFYITFAQSILKDLVTFRWNNLKNWENYSPKEMAAARQTLTDLTVMMTCWLIYGMLLGYDPDDPDKMKKLKEKSWAQQMTIYLMLKTKSETEQFIPLPGMGLDEIKRIYTNPSLIFSQTTNMMVMLKQVLQHTGGLVGISDTDSLYYSKKQSDASIFGMTLKDKGDSKLFANALQTFGGVSGKSWTPLDLLKGFQYSQRLK